jgi:hypothetical protein
MVSDLQVFPKERVCIAPPSSWVRVSSFDPAFKGNTRDHLSYPLLSRQIHAENRQTFIQTVTRLETMQAVQRESQWRLPFDPTTQSITLHWIKIHRGEQCFDQTLLDKMRLLQREEGLEGYVIDGWYTILILLDDVRPGDLLESCYTIQSQPRLLPESCGAFFNLPQEFSVGEYRFSVLFDHQKRPMQWKSSSPALAPAVKNLEEGSLWEWFGRNHVGCAIEPNIPQWYAACPWIQISDSSNWQIIADAVSAAWREVEDDPVVEETADQICSAEPDVLNRVLKALQIVQDGCRYLSVNIDLGGHVPAPPGNVLRRNYGDCKDLSFLLVHLLKRLGISAQPVLVNSILRKSVADMLPMLGVFNHALVEFEVQGHTRWVDPTIKRQGGNALTRISPDFGFGLRINQSSSTLTPQPMAAREADLYELKESVFLDTTGGPSLVAMSLRAVGRHAEMFRHQFDTYSVDAVAKERLQNAANRYSSASRVGQLQCRDNLETNEFLMAEIFEINGFLSNHSTPRWCFAQLPPSIVVSALPIPEKGGARKMPFAIPNPCNVTHIFEVEFPTLEPMGGPRHYSDNPFVQFSQRSRSLHGFWSVTFSLATKTDVVLPERIEDYRRVLNQVWQDSCWTLTLPVGYPRPRLRRGLGELPPARKPLDT